MSQVAPSLFTRVTRNIAARGAPTPLASRLAPLRRHAAERVLAEHRERAAELTRCMQSGAPGAQTAFAEFAEGALAQMRQTVAFDAQRSGLSSACAAAVDSWWRETTASEYLDDPGLDERVRVRILEHLDAVNDLLDIYRALFDRLLPMLHPERLTRVLDLAAGHGGFALSLARRARRNKIEIDLVASDIKREYLALGEARAKQEALPVRFVVQDALDLGNLEPESYDVVISMQSLHHFTPGQVAVMFAEAARIAARGLLFTDGARSALNAAGLLGLGLFRYGDAAFAHDALVSFRRFFVPEELELLARLGPVGQAARATWVPPGHCLLSLSK